MSPTLLILATLTLSAPALRGEEIRLHRIEFKDGKRMTAQLMGEEKEFYILSLNGTPLYIKKSSVRKIEPLPPQRRDSTGGASAGSLEASGANEKNGGERKLQELLRSAVEEMSSTDNEVVRRAWRFLSENFAAARPILHEALRHEHPRVRRLAVKLLGERGTAEMDLKPAAGLLFDSKATVRLAAIMAVRALGPEGMREMARCLKTEIQPNLRKMAVKTLQRWRDLRAAAPLAERLQRETDAGVRAFLATALEALTGQRFGQDARAWSDYLRAQQRRREMERISKLKQTQKNTARDGAASAGEQVDVEEKHEKKQQ